MIKHTLKHTIITILFILILAQNIFAKKSDYYFFKENIKKEKYITAMNIYSQNINGEITNKFQNYILKRSITLMSKDISKASELLDSFLQVQYDHSMALFIYSKIHLINEEFTKSLELLYKLKNTYLENDFDLKVKNTITNVAQKYINSLYKENNIIKLEETIGFFTLYNDIDNMKLTKLSLIKIFDNQKKDNPLKAIQILINLKNMYNDENINQSINNKYNRFLISYIKDLIKQENLEDMQKLKEVLQIHNDIQNIDKLEKSIQKIKEKNNLSKIYNKAISLQKDGEHYIINANINNTPITLMLDTGASKTSINNSFTQQINYITLNDNIKVRTAAGIVTNELIQVKTFQIDEVQLNNYNIIVSHIDVFEKYDGVLGMNFLNKFKFYIDQEKSILYLN